MPQFDQFSFFNQVSWVLFIFFNFYFFITYFFLPTICYNLKFRKKKIIFDNKKRNQINFEKNNMISFFNNSYKTFCSNFELFIIKKIAIYKKNQKIKIQETPIFNNILKKKINILLNQKFLLFKKIFILIN
uniref:ATP synthase F0 subunit 8 n=1 Tax=Phytophthora fragariae TaxID=53985 RepID=UPI0020298824|nr:ATP synthase F0 subunit 8 [Phytophthora fragariae]DAZ88340.1 TPA_asm: ATP synthase F0 subunit 8 [Phytophthora fragariae]